MSVKYIQYKGRTIFFVDFSNKNGDQLIAVLEEESKEMRTWTKKGNRSK